jgi:hypothetical protein
MHLIPWVLLKQAIAFKGDETQPETPVILSNRTLHLLIEAALAGQDFDEIAYFRSNPDVARSVRDGHCPSAWVHYLLTGYYEGRMAGRTGFDEAWYLERYPDIKRAIASGECQSGHDHYADAGIREWRSPNKTAEPDIFRWHQAVSESTQALAHIPPHPAKRPKPLACGAKSQIGQATRPGRSPPDRQGPR